MNHAWRLELEYLTSGSSHLQIFLLVSMQVVEDYIICLVLLFYNLVFHPAKFARFLLSVKVSCQLALRVECNLLVLIFHRFQFLTFQFIVLIFVSVADTTQPCWNLVIESSLSIRITAIIKTCEFSYFSHFKYHDSVRGHLIIYNQFLLNSSNWFIFITKP